MHNRLIACLFGAIAPVVVMFTAPAAATVLDPQIVICQTSVCPSLVTDPELIPTPTTGFFTGVQGSDTLQNPLLLIVAVYNGTGTPVLTFASNPVPLALVGTYGLTGNGVTFTSGLVGDALGLAVNASETFAQLKAGDTANGFTAPTSFTLDVFAVPTKLNSTGITLDESGAAAGSYLMAFGCIDGTGTNTVGQTAGGCASQGDVGSTVWTNTGLIDCVVCGGGNSPPPIVPEPGTLFILGSGLAGLALVRRYRKFV
jgi:hypothetical protein